METKIEKDYTGQDIQKRKLHFVSIIVQGGSVGGFFGVEW